MNNGFTTFVFGDELIEICRTRKDPLMEKEVVRIVTTRKKRKKREEEKNR